MAFQPLLRQHLLPLAGLSAGLALIPTRSVRAEEPVEDPIRAIRVRKPIYDSPPEPSAREISATTPPPASGITSKPQEQQQPPAQNSLTSLITGSTPPARQTPTDRLASEIKRLRLTLHTFASRTEDSINNTMTRLFSLEQTFTTTLSSLRSPHEPLLPGSIYILVASMAGSIISRNRNILLRFATPVITGVGTAHYVLPRTTANVGDLVWEWEKKFPVVADSHLRARERVGRFVETGRAHSAMGLQMAEERVMGVREAVEEWVRKGK